MTPTQPTQPALRPPNPRLLGGKPAQHTLRIYRRLLVTATLLAFALVALGAYVRLSDAGLGCPDWPGCYGQLLGVPAGAGERAAAQLAFPERPLEAHKAWKEMAHRYLAAVVGLLIALITVFAWLRRQALRASPWLPTLLLGVVGVQALLGMLTVTRLLKPLIVSAHLLGGMATLALLVCLVASHTSGPVAQQHSPPRARCTLHAHAALALLAIVAQIALGGWVSSNYAALACSDLPTCLGAWVPEMDFAHAFTLQRELGYTHTGDLLPLAALTAIHWSHRVGAVLVALIVATLAWRLARRPNWRGWGLALAATLALQIGLGVANVALALPLPVAVAHNAGAALLLALGLTLKLRLRRVDAAA